MRNYNALIIVTFGTLVNPVAEYDICGNKVVNTGRILRKMDEKNELSRQNNISEIIERTGKKLGVVLFELGVLTPHNLDLH